MKMRAAHPRRRRRNRKEGVITGIGTTAVIVLLPDGEQLLDLARQLAPELVRPMPAHVTLLYPGPELTQATLDDVDQFGAHLPAEADLRETRIGDNGFVGIGVPDLDNAVSRFRARFPSLVPYSGRFGADPSAHLTLALDAAPTQARQIGQRVAGDLPRRSRVIGPRLVVRTGTGWQQVRSPA